MRASGNGADKSAAVSGRGVCGGWIPTDVPTHSRGQSPTQRRKAGIPSDHSSSADAVQIYPA